MTATEKNNSILKKKFNTKMNFNNSILKIQIFNIKKIFKKININKILKK